MAINSSIVISELRLSEKDSATRTDNESFIGASATEGSATVSSDSGWEQP